MCDLNSGVTGGEEEAEEEMEETADGCADEGLAPHCIASLGWGSNREVSPGKVALFMLEPCPPTCRETPLRVQLALAIRAGLSTPQTLPRKERCQGDWQQPLGGDLVLSGGT